MKAIVSISLLLFILSGCTKYEEGPMFTVRTNKNRLCKTWEKDEKENIESGNETAINDVYWTINNDGTYETEGELLDTKGTWSFVGDDIIKFVPEGVITTPVEFTIVKLYNDDFVLKDENFKYYFEPK